MKGEMHLVKGGQLRYYRQPLEELGASVKEVQEGLNALETALSTITNEYAIKVMEHSINNVSLELERMLEVYTLRSDNPSITDDEFLQMALDKKESFRDVLKRVGKGQYK